MPISNSKYISPMWTNGAAPALNASEMQAITDTVAKLDTHNVIKKEAARFTQSGTWTCPAGITSIDVYLVGGGGAGGGGAPQGYSGCGGGGGGGYAKLFRNVAVTPGTSYTITIGAGGTSAANGDGNSGGQTKFGTNYTANGGAGGKAGYRSAGAGGNGGCGGGGGTFGGGIAGNGGTGGSAGGYGRTLEQAVSGSAIIIGYSNGGDGGGNSDYCPINPYDGIAYGCGGGGGPDGTGGGASRDAVLGPSGIGAGGSGSRGSLAGTQGATGGGGGGGGTNYLIDSSSTLGGNGGAGICIIYA